MSNDSRWLYGGCAGLLGVAGLFVASHAGGGLLYWIGLLAFLAAVAAVFNLIRIAFDEAEGKADAQGAHHLVAFILVLVAVGSVLFHLVSPWWWTPIASNWSYIDNTISLTFLITGIVFAAVVLFMAYCVLRFRHRKGHRAAYEPESKGLEWSLTVATGIGVIAMLAPGLVVWNQFVTVPDDATEIEIVAQQWQWSYRFPGQDGQLGKSDATLVASDNPMGLNRNDPAGQDDVIVDGGELHLPVGKPVKVLLRSMDVLHNFYVPEFRAKMDMIPGMITYFWITPTRTGSFGVLCAELCGVGHALMRGGVVVEEEGAYQAWLQQRPTFAQLSAPRYASAEDSIPAPPEGAAAADKSKPLR